MLRIAANAANNDSDKPLHEVPLPPLQSLLPRYGLANRIRVPFVTIARSRRMILDRWCHPEALRRQVNVCVHEHAAKEAGYRGDRYYVAMPSVPRCFLLTGKMTRSKKSAIPSTSSSHSRPFNETAQMRIL